MKKQNTIIILSVAIIMVVSGCSTKKPSEFKPVVNSQTPNQAQLNKVATSTVSEVVATSSDAIDTSDWETYKNDEYGFEIKYLPNWVILQRENEGNKLFISFTNSSTICSKDNCPANFLAFYISVYQKPSDEYNNLFNEYRKIGFYEKVNTYTGETVEVFSINNNNQKPDKTWDMIKPDMKAFYQDKNKSIVFYIATEIPSNSNGQKKEVEILKEVIRSYKSL